MSPFVPTYATARNTSAVHLSPLLTALVLKSIYECQSKTHEVCLVKKEKGVKLCSSFYLIEVCILSSGESEAALLGLKGQEAGKQTFGDL